MKKWLLATVLGATMIFASACGGGSNQEAAPAALTMRKMK